MSLNKYIKNKVIIRTTLISSIVLFVYFAFNPFLTPYLVSKGFAKDQISYAMSIAPIILIFLSAVIGRISDVIGRNRVIIFSLIMLMISYLILININSSLILLVISVVLITAGYEVFKEASFSRIQDNTNDVGRGEFTGIYESMISAGALIGTLCGTYLVTVANISILLKTVLVVIMSIFCILFFHKHEKRAKISSRKLKPLNGIKSFLSIRGLRGMAINGFAMNFAQAGKNVFIPLFVTQTLRADVAYVGVLAAILSTCHLTQFYWGKKCDINGSKNIIILFSLLLSASYIALFFSNSIVNVMICVSFIGLFAAAWNTSALCFMSSIGEKKNEEGAIIGSYSSLSHIGVALGFVVSGYLSTYLDIRYIFLVYGVIGLLAAFLSRKMIMSEK